MDILKYKAELEAKLKAVNAIIKDMTANKPSFPDNPSSGPTRVLSAETRQKMKDAWAKRKAEAAAKETAEAAKV